MHALILAGEAEDRLRGLSDTLHRLGCESVTLACAPPWSLHALASGLATIPPGPVLCAVVDAVMPEDDWRQVVARADRLLARGADACAVVTPVVEAEQPLYVARHPAGSVAAFQEAPAFPVLVTGGVYFLSSRVRSLAPPVLALGIARLRGF